jgi:4-oxalocrotonate tautomerase
MDVNRTALPLIVAAASVTAGQCNANQNEGEEMPFINVKLIEDVFTPEQKRRIVEELTDAMVAIEGEAMRPFTLVVVEEVRSGDWGVAGKALTTQDVRALAAVPA